MDRRGMLGLDLGTAAHEDLYRARMGAAPHEQGALAPAEHRAFAREFAAESPALAAVSLPFAIPAYSAAKALGLMKARTPASLDEVFAGYHGLAEGMLNRMVPSAQAHHEQSETVQREDGKWINVYGRGTPRAGQQLPGSGAFDTVEEAVRAARGRSEEGYKAGVNGAMRPGGMLAPRKRGPRIPGMPSPYHGMLERGLDYLVPSAHASNWGSPKDMADLSNRLRSIPSAGPASAVQAPAAQTSTAPVRYQVYDRRTGQVVGEYNNKTRARNVVDKKDNEYGAYRYAMRVKPESGGGGGAAGGGKLPPRDPNPLY